MAGFAHFQEQIYAAVFTNHPAGLQGGLDWRQRPQLRRGAIDQMPIEQMFHAVPEGIGGFDIGAQKETARGQPLIHDIHQTMTHLVGQIIE